MLCQSYIKDTNWVKQPQPGILAGETAVVYYTRMWSLERVHQVIIKISSMWDLKKQGEQPDYYYCVSRHNVFSWDDSCNVDSNVSALCSQLASSAKTLKNYIADVGINALFSLPQLCSWITDSNQNFIHLTSPLGETEIRALLRGKHTAGPDGEYGWKQSETSGCLSFLSSGSGNEPPRWSYWVQHSGDGDRWVRYFLGNQV